MCRLVNKDDMNPDCPLGSDEFVSAGKFSRHDARECYDVVRSGVDVVSICGLLSEQVSVMLLIPRRNLGTPMAKGGGEGNRTPVRNVGGTTYPQRGCLKRDLNPRPWLYKSPALPLCYSGDRNTLPEMVVPVPPLRT